MPLSTVDRLRRVHEIERPPGDEQVVTAANAVVRLRAPLFAPVNLSVPRGADPLALR
ncbi:MAG TPA: hypothetical protein VF526_04090 [Solirubrobacteraceae bacterium]